MQQPPNQPSQPPFPQNQPPYGQPPYGQPPYGQPPYPPQQFPQGPQGPQVPQGPRQPIYQGNNWFGRQTRTTQIITGIVGIVVCCLCGGIATAINGGGKSTTQAQANNTAGPTATATATRAPTATPDTGEHKKVGETITVSMTAAAQRLRQPLSPSRPMAATSSTSPSPAIPTSSLT